MESRLLRVDLSTGELRTETLPHALYERWIGGSGINDWLLWRHFLERDIDCDPRGPDNALVFGVGPLAGVGAGSGVKGRIAFKSPWYGMFGDSSAGGKFPYQVRFAGFDHIAITGRAPRPVYLYLCDGAAEIRDAAHLRGKSTAEAHAALARELGDRPSNAHTLTIGPAGENQVGIAGVVSDASRTHARAGGGCVMGSKNLKAIAVQGSGGVRVRDPRGLLSARERGELFGRDQRLAWGTWTTSKRWCTTWPTAATCSASSFATALTGVRCATPSGAARP